MDPNFDSNMYNEFTFNSSPIATHTYQIDDLKLGIGIDNSRFADFDYTSNYSTFGLDSSFCQPSQAQTTEAQSAEVSINFPNQTFQLSDEIGVNANLSPKREKMQQIVPKPKRKPMIFQPFASFEATEITIQSLKRGILNKQNAKSMTRAHSLQVMGLDL